VKKEITKPTKKHTSVELPEDEHKALFARAKEEGVTTSLILRMLIKAYLAKEIRLEMGVKVQP